MLLLHIYTLDAPDFTNKTLHSSPYVAAEAALKIGDKYNLPNLSKAGCRYMQKRLESFIKGWPQKSTADKETVIRRLERLWRTGDNEAGTLRDAVMEQLVAMSKHVIEFEPFQHLCTDEPAFALALIRAQAKALEDKISSAPKSRDKKSTN